MKIRPMPRQEKLHYPSQEEARQNPGLLKNIPARWEKAPGFAAMLGLLALSSHAGAEVAEEGTLAVVALDPEAPDGARPTAQAVRKAGAVVAPILDAALEHDGRGSFGCVAINPPTFLPEDEALDLIRAELEAAGLHLQNAEPLQNVTAPVGPDRETKRTTLEDGSIRIESNMGWGKPNALGLRPVRFDWADTNRAVYIEYLTRRDYREWEGMSNSTADYYDFSKLAQRVAESYGKYEADKPVIFGVFFDPLAHRGALEPPMEGLSPEQAQLARVEQRKASKAAPDARARAKLQRQVQHFVEFLQKEGVIADAK